MKRLTLLRQLRSHATQQNKRYLSISTQLRLDLKHSPETYTKNVDQSPPEGTLHSVDPESESVQRPTDPLTGPWSRAGAQTEEYHHVDGQSAPYAPEDGDKGRYGSRDSWLNDKGKETSKGDESASEKSAGGRSG